MPISTTPGLQVLDRQGQWHEVICEPSTVVMNAGDMLQHTTGGFYPSTTHRVVTPAGQEDKARYSLVLFAQPHGSAVLSPGYTAGDFFKERFLENGLYAA